MADDGSDEPTSGPDPLLAWALAAFHATALVAVGVLAIHLDARAGYVLQDRSTALGFAAFLYLWATAWWTARGWLRDGGALADALTWGSANGLAVFAPGFLVVFVPLAFNGASPAFLLLALVVGALVAAAVGALVGGLFAVLDRALLRAGRSVVSP
jgi:hypothetical protein